MTNTEKLVEIIQAMGLKYKYIAEQLGISPYAFSLKMKNKNEFKSSEVAIMCSILNITSLEMKDEIFFAQ